MDVTAGEIWPSSQASKPDIIAEVYTIVLEVKLLELQQNAVMQQQLLIVKGQVRVFNLFFLLESDSQYEVEVHPYQNLRHVVLFYLRLFCP